MIKTSGQGFPSPDELDKGWIAACRAYLGPDSWLGAPCVAVASNRAELSGKFGHDNRLDTERSIAVQFHRVYVVPVLAVGPCFPVHPFYPVPVLYSKEFGSH